MSPPRQSRGAGFTLIEVAVALALLGMIAVALVTSLQFARSAYTKVVRTDAATWDVFSTQRLLRQLIESAYPIEERAGAEVGLTGTMERLTVLSPAPRAAGGGLYRYHLTLQPNGTHVDLVLSWVSDLDDAQGMEHRSREVLLPRVAGVRWEYCCTGTFASGVGSSAATPRWENTWSQRQLPRLVRLRVELPKGDVRSWPDLIVAPRLTDDANCVFDVVAQRCRRSM